jgi:Fic family protein
MHAALDNLEKFLHDRSPMPVLIKAGLAHAQFETIHPFQDGNGRVGRLLITLLLCHDAALRLPLLHLSSFFARHQSEYYDRLQAIHDRGDWEGWLMFFLRGTSDVAQEAAATGREAKRLQENHRRLIAERLGRRASSALRVLDQLAIHPIVTVEGVVAMAQLSYKSANTLVRQLSDLGILRELTGQRRNRRFSYAPYLALFTDTEVANQEPS